MEVVGGRTEREDGEEWSIGDGNGWCGNRMAGWEKMGQRGWCLTVRAWDGKMEKDGTKRMVFDGAGVGWRDGKRRCG